MGWQGKKWAFRLVLKMSVLCPQAGAAPPDLTALRSRIIELEEEREESLWKLEQYEELKGKNGTTAEHEKLLLKLSVLHLFLIEHAFLLAGNCIKLGCCSY